MGDAKQELAKVIARRRLDEGEFSYVLRMGGEPVAGKKAVYARFKELQPEVFAKLLSSCQHAGETDEAFDTRMLRLIPQLPFEEVAGAKAGGKMEVDEVKQTLTADQLHRVVRVDGVERSLGQDVVEGHFCREFEGVESVEKAKNAFGPPKGQSYDVTFKEEKFANTFLETKDLKLQEKSLTAQLLASFIQTKIMKRQLNLAFAHNQRLIGCVPLEAGKEDAYLLVFGIGRPSEEELQEYFLGLESEFEGVVSAKSVQNVRGDGPNGKLLGILVQFESNAALVKFTQLKEVKYKEHTLRYNVMSEVIRNIEVRTKKANFVVDDGPTTQQLADRRIILLRLKGEFDPVVEKILKAHFPEAKDVRHCPVDRLTVVTFPSAAAAQQAVRAGDECDLMKPVTVLPLTEYLEKRQVILEEESGRMEKIKTKYENIKNSFVKVDGNKITITDPDPKPEPESKSKKKENKDTFKEAKEALVPKPAAAVAPAHPIMKKRANRGPNAFDVFVGVKGFAEHIKNMGKASDMDICNYFIHNHKDVADVKFVNWTDIVFAKFKSVGAAEQFITLNYHLFYGVELVLHDVPTFLGKNKKSDQQKEDVAKILLGKKFNESMVKGGTNGTNGATNGSAQPAAKAPGTPEVVLAGFSSQQAGEGIRDLFIENLHLDQEVVGQPMWVKGTSGDNFNARLSIKLEEQAIGYLVRKWNDLEIAVEGETVVKAEVVGGGGVGSPAKRGRRPRGKQAGGKRPKISLEDY